MFTTLRLGQRGIIPYILVQGVLSFSITVIGDNTCLAIGLYMMLIGECLGALGLNWRGFAAMAYLLTLSAINFYLLLNGEQFTIWILTVGLSSVFVFMFVWLFDRQNKAREAVQNAWRELDTAQSSLHLVMHQCSIGSSSGNQTNVPGPNSPQ